jgi:hypothetical protein
MKILVIVIHADIKSSHLKKRWTEELNKFAEKYFIHQLQEVYPDEKN